jgi:hypothetical protein
VALTEHPLPLHVSHSQKNSFAECPERFRLERVWKVPQAPSWWLIGGSALHLATETWDQHQFDPEVEILTFEDAFRLGIEQAQEKNPEYEPEEYRAANKGTENGNWWEKNGPIFLQNYKDWRAQSPWDIAILGDRPAIELEVTLRFDDGTAAIQYLDRVFVTSTGAHIIGDLKSGKNLPPTPDQVGDYKVGLEQDYPGIEFRWGVFWDARKGTNHPLVDLAPYTKQRVAYEYAAFKFARDQGVYLPNRDKHCGWCGVKDFCIYADGARANEVRPPWVSPQEWEAR